MTRNLASFLGLLSWFAGCVSVTDARERGSSRFCAFEERCGNVGAGKRYATFADCLTDKRAFFLAVWPTEPCDGRINAETLNVCYQAIETAQCNNLRDFFNTFSKCESADVCTANAPAGCNCTNGQTCCNNVCTSLQTDRRNCGGCGTTCGPSLDCQSGVCR
jgi:hypothetical protein